MSVSNARWSVASLRHRFAIVAALTFALTSFNVPFVSFDREASAANNSVGVDLDQWANDSPAGWQNGDLNGNNSAYGEGRVVPFRVAIEGLSSGQHSFHVNYDWTAGGHKAYDFLASYDATEGTVAGQACATGGGAVSSLCPSLPSVQLVPFTADPFSSSGSTVDGAIAFAG